MKNTSEDASLRRTPPLQHNPSLASRAHLTPLHTFTSVTDNQYWPLNTKEILTNTILTNTTKYSPPPTLKRYDAFLSPFAEHNHTSALIHIHHSSNPTFNPLTPPFITSDLILPSFQAALSSVDFKPRSSSHNSTVPSNTLQHAFITDRTISNT